MSIVIHYRTQHPYFQLPRLESLQLKRRARRGIDEMMLMRQLGR